MVTLRRYQRLLRFGTAGAFRKFGKVLRGRIRINHEWEKSFRRSRQGNMAACILFSCRNDLPFWTGYQWRGKFRHTTLPTSPTEASQAEKESIREAQNKTRREAPRKKTTENKNTEAARPKGKGLLEKPPTVYYWGILFFTKKNDKFIKHALMAKSCWSIEEKHFLSKSLVPCTKGSETTFIQKFYNWRIMKKIFTICSFFLFEFF